MKENKKERKDETGRKKEPKTGIRFNMKMVGGGIYIFGENIFTLG